MNNKLGLIFQCASHAGFSQATPLGSNWNWQAAVNIADNISYPQGGLSDGALHAVWTTGSSSPYWIDRYLEANPLAKSAFRTTMEPEVSRSASLNIEKAAEKYPALSALKGRVHVRLSSPYTGESKSKLAFAKFDSLSTQSDWLSAVAFVTAEPILADISVMVKDFGIADRNKTIPYAFPVLQNTTLSNGSKSVNTLLNIGAILLKGESSFNSSYIMEYGTLPIGSRVCIDLPEGYLSGFVSLTEEYFTSETDSVSLGKELPQVAESVPVTEGLLENYPNPFNPETEIRFGIETPSEISLSIYDLLGREVTRLKEGQIGRGMHTMRWNAATNPSGVYVVRLTIRTEGKGMTWQKKILLLK